MILVIFCSRPRGPKTTFVKDFTDLFRNSDINIRADFVGKFSACYGGRPRGRFSNLRFGVTLTFKLIAIFKRKHAMEVSKVSLVVDCQTKIVKCDCAAKENFEVKIIVLTFGCILINKVYW